MFPDSRFADKSCSAFHAALGSAQSPSIGIAAAGEGHIFFYLAAHRNEYFRRYLLCGQFAL